MADQAERKILDMVEQGQISPEEGLRLMNAMGTKRRSVSAVAASQADAMGIGAEAVDEIIEPTHPQIPEEEQRRMNRLKRWWVLPFGIGLLITALGSTWMYTGYISRGFRWGFWLAWIPFLLGIFIVAVSFQTSRSVWLHLRVKQRPGEKPERISISLPLPIALTRWFLSVFGRRIPGLRDQPLGNYSEILDSLSPEEPFYVHVNDEDGEEVEVFIG